MKVKGLVQVHTASKVAKAGQGEESSLVPPCPWKDSRSPTALGPQLSS